LVRDMVWHEVFCEPLDERREEYSIQESVEIMVATRGDRKKYQIFYSLKKRSFWMCWRRVEELAVMVARNFYWL